MQALLKDVEQLALFETGEDDGTGLLFLEERKQGVNTGEQLKKDQELYHYIVWLLGKGFSLRETAEIATKRRDNGIKISKNTIHAIKKSEGLGIGTVKKRISNQLKEFADRASARLLDEVDSIPIGQLAVPLGIAIQRAQDLDGEPNVRIEHTHKKLYSFDEFINKLPSAGTDLIGEETAQKEDDLSQANQETSPSE